MPQMTLEQVRNWHMECAVVYERSRESALADQHRNLAAAIAAHITQPAQAVDVERIVAAMGHLPDNRAATRHELIRAFTLTAAFPKDSNGAEGADCWRLIATAPKDGKEVLVAFTADGVRQVAEASWSDDEDVWVCSRDGFMLYRRNEPTHWMPLPDAPQEGVEK